MCYCYFRLGKAWLSLPAGERILTGLFFCSRKPDKMLEALRPGWNEKTSLPLQEKYLIAGLPGAVTGVFPWPDELSRGIDHERFSESFFIQPDLFLRLRPGQETAVVRKLESAGMDFGQLTDTCLSLPNASKVEDTVELNREAVVQDYSSQRIGGLLKEAAAGPAITVWDCCAASGGKSIMTKDILGNIALVVSDIRESILVNLKKRFNEAGIKNYKSFCADISLPGSVPSSLQAGLIICDVPCTGSGTWGRTPEQLFYFEANRIAQYAAKQKKIVSNVLPHLLPGGYLLYSTCSVFRKENEETVEFICRQPGIAMVRSGVLNGYDKKADTLFAALFRKSS